MTIFPEDIGLNLLYGDIEKDLDNIKMQDNELGTPTFTPAVIASYQSMEAVKIILNKNNIFRNTMVHFNLMTGYIEKFKF